MRKFFITLGLITFLYHNAVVPVGKAGKATGKAVAKVSVKVAKAIY